MKKEVEKMQIFKRAFCSFVVFVLLFVLCACDPSEKVFSANGMSITLTDEFSKEKDYYGMLYYDSEEAQVYIAKEEIDVLEEKGEKTDYTLKEYADYLLKSISVTAEIKTEDNITFFEYSKKPEDVSYNYFVAVFKTSDAFWYFQFACESNLLNEYRPLFKTWAKSIKFDDNKNLV